MTNGDYIRSMMNMELAELLSGENPYPWCETDTCQADCRDCIFQWLKEEKEEEEE